MEQRLLARDLNRDRYRIFFSKEVHKQCTCFSFPISAESALNDLFGNSSPINPHLIAPAYIPP